MLLSTRSSEHVEGRARICAWFDKLTTSGSDHLLSPRVFLELLHERGGALRVARNHENRVVAADGAHRLRQLRAIDGDCERLRLADAGPDDDELLHAVDALQIFLRRALERGERGFRVGGVRAGALVRAVAGALHEAELLDVARDRRLRRVEPALTEPPAHFLLAVQRLAVDELDDGGLAARFHGSKNQHYTSIFVESMRVVMYNYAFRCIGMVMPSPPRT